MSRRAGRAAAGRAVRIVHRFAAAPQAVNECVENEHVAIGLCSEIKTAIGEAPFVSDLAYNVRVRVVAIGKLPQLFAEHGVRARCEESSIHAPEDFGLDA